MEKREKIKQVYKKLGIIAGKDIIDSILEDETRYKSMMRLYRNKEIKSMNDIFEKEDKNEYFTQEELEFVKDIDLFDRYSIEIAKMIWKAKDNSKLLKVFLSILEEEMRKETSLLLKIVENEEVVA